MNYINKTSIEWADYTWNPVWGCLKGCAYCYAKKINDRFRIINKNFKPEWIEANFIKNFPNEKSVIFVNSMSDIAFWDIEWIEKVFNKISLAINNGHKFLFLTKFPIESNKIIKKYQYINNVFWGITIEDCNKMLFFNNIGIFDNFDFISIEPIQSFFSADLLNVFDWVIVGQETGNRKNKIIPDYSWIDEFFKTTANVFMKNNLNIITKDLIQEFPNWLR